MRPRQHSGNRSFAQLEFTGNRCQTLPGVAEVKELLLIAVDPRASTDPPLRSGGRQPSHGAFGQPHLLLLSDHRQNADDRILEDERKIS